MLIFDFHDIGNKLYTFRKKLGLTQAEVAEAAGLSDRTYADIERGSVNMRIETVLRICEALKITPDEILTHEAAQITPKQEEIWNKLSNCSPKERDTAFRLLAVYFDSIEK